MLKADKFFVLILLFLTACTGTKSKEQSEKELKQFESTCKNVAIKTLGNNQEYDLMYKTISDTINSWIENKLPLYDISNLDYRYMVDSLFVINSTRDKIIGVELRFNGIQTHGFTDGIIEFYGAKIDGGWYFWTGAFTPVMRKVDGHDPSLPFSYKELHKMALGFCGGYLDKQGKIRDSWFESKFKSSGYGRFKDRYEYKSILDGQRIDIEKEYWEYIWKRKGLGGWISKFSEVTINQKEIEMGRKLSRDEKNEITTAVTLNMMSKSIKN